MPAWQQTDKLKFSCVILGLKVGENKLGSMISAALVTFLVGLNDVFQKAFA